MKTPEETKKGLECCSKTDKCPECPYMGEDYCATKKNVDALAYIRQLEIRNGAIEKALDEVFVLNDKQASIIRNLNSNKSQVRKTLQDNGFGSLEKLLQAYSQVKRERDAAVKDMKKMASSRDGVRCSVCRYRKAGSLGPCERCIISDSWEWRGVQEKEENNG